MPAAPEHHEQQHNRSGRPINPHVQASALGHRYYDGSTGSIQVSKYRDSGTSNAAFRIEETHGADQLPMRGDRRVREHNHLTILDASLPAYFADMVASRVCFAALTLKLPTIESRGGRTRWS